MSLTPQSSHDPSSFNLIWEDGGAWRGTIGRGVMEGDDRGRRGEVLTCRERERGSRVACSFNLSPLPSTCSSHLYTLLNIEKVISSLEGILSLNNC